MNIFIYKNKLYFIYILLFNNSIFKESFYLSRFCVCVCKKYILYILHIQITNNTTANNGIDEIKTGQR